MIDGVYMFESDYRKQVWLVKDGMRKVLKDLSTPPMIVGTGLFMDFQPNWMFVPIQTKLYQYLRTLTDEEKLEYI